MTNIEKAKLLRESRKRLGWTQLQMAEALGLDPTYLSQLENGHRDVDEWYLSRATDIEKAKLVKPDALTEELESREISKDECLDYLGRFLDNCNDQAKLGWTLMELHERFPLDKWAALSVRHKYKVNSKQPSEAQRLLKRASASAKTDPSE